MRESIFFTHTIVAVVPVATLEQDELGVPIELPPGRIEMPASFVPAMNADVTKAAADQTVVGYHVQTPNSFYQALALASWLELPLPGEEDDRYRIIGRIGYIPDGFEVAGYCQMVVEKVEG